MNTKERNFFKRLACALLTGIGLVAQAFAQNPTPPVQIPVTIKIDSAKQQAKAKDTVKKIMPYQKLITAKAVKQHGLITVDKVDNKWYLEIPESILGKDVLIENFIAGAAADNKPEYRKGNRSMDGYAGDEINQTIVRFQRHGNNILVREISYVNYGLKPGDPMYDNTKRSDVQPIILTLPIKATAPDSSRVVDITPTVDEDNPLLTFDPAVKKGLKLGAYQTTNSYLEGICAFPQNLSFKMVKTYAKDAGGSSLLNGLPGTSTLVGNATYELSSSWVLLPEVPMKTRQFDHRVGYFATGYTDFGKDPQTVKLTVLAARWRLEPKPEDRQKYLAGELVEPAKPIVIYIDPTTPEKWVPYLISGVNDWQKAFERAGFKNAIVARRAPTKAEDSTWSIEDARYSVLVYKPSSISNASGPHLSDPRTGEILETHINWYHNVMALVHSWYMVQCGAVDPRARKAEFDDELMGQLIRFVSSHEVGHTLGLRHNFIASNGTPVEKLRDKAWVEAHGHTASIMDYARFNYVAQPEDNIGPAGLYPRIGDYDKWAIEWGYKWFGDITAEKENGLLKTMIRDSLKNPRLRFGPGAEEGEFDPRAQAEDLGDDNMKANTYGMKNLKYVAQNMSSWLTKKDGSDYQDLIKGYSGLVNQYIYFLLHSLTYIGGIYDDNQYADQSSNNFSPVPIDKQVEAIDFIDRFYFHEPSWLTNESITGRVLTPQVNIMPQLEKILMAQLYDPARLGRLLNCEERYGAKAYRPIDYLANLQDRIWSELKTGAKFTTYRMQLQNEDLSQLGSIVNPNVDGLTMDGIISALTKGSVSKTEMAPVARMQLNDLDRNIARYLKSGRAIDALTRAHLENARATIDKILGKKV